MTDGGEEVDVIQATVRICKCVSLVCGGVTMMGDATSGNILLTRQSSVFPCTSSVNARRWTERKGGKEVTMTQRKLKGDMYLRVGSNDDQGISLCVSIRDLIVYERNRS